jgi:hypothetical protein
MDALIETLTSHFENLLGRTAGPFNFRLLIMPLVVTFFAVRAAMRDAQQGQPPFFRTLFTEPGGRARLLRSMLKDIGKIFVVATVLDTTYQILVLKSFYLGELLVVVLVTALLPYLVVRSAVSPLMRRIYRKQAKPGNPEEVAKNPTPAKPNTDH